MGTAEHVETNAQEQTIFTYKKCAYNDQFALTGRLHDHGKDPIPTPLTLSDTSYSRDTSGTHIDVNAVVGRQNKTVPVPVLTVGHNDVNPVKMVGPDSKNKFYAQLKLPATDKPGIVTVTNSAISPSVSMSTAVKDVVKVLSADFNPGDNTVTIDATSSDKGDAPPTLSVLGYPDIVSTTAPGTTVSPDPSISHFVIFVGETVPPDFMTVLSDAGGRETIKVDKGLDPDKYSQPGVPFAKDDTVAPNIEVDSQAITIAVLDNDLGTIDATTLRLVPIKTANLGVASIVNGQIQYKPGSIAGEDTFTYSVGNNVGQSNTATVTVNINWSVLGPKPTAFPDGPFSSNVNSRVITIPIAVLLQNDKSNDLTNPSQYALNSASIVTSNVMGGTATVDGTDVIYTPSDASATTGGSFGFDYTVTNTKGNVSNPARVIVNVAAQERITATLTCVVNTRKWSGTGTSTARIKNKMTVSKIELGGAKTVISSNVAVNATTGAWTLPGTTGPACTGAKKQTTPVSITSSYGTIFNTVARNN